MIFSLVGHNLMSKEKNDIKVEITQITFLRIFHIYTPLKGLFVSFVEISLVNYLHTLICQLNPAQNLTLTYNWTQHRQIFLRKIVKFHQMLENPLTIVTNNNSLDFIIFSVFQLSGCQNLNSWEN